MRNLTDCDIEVADRYRDDCGMLRRFRVEEGEPDAWHDDSGFYIWCIRQAVAEADHAYRKRVR